MLSFFEAVYTCLSPSVSNSCSKAREATDNQIKCLIFKMRLGKAILCQRRMNWEAFLGYEQSRKYCG